MNRKKLEAAMIAEAIRLMLEKNDIASVGFQVGVDWLDYGLAVHIVWATEGGSSVKQASMMIDEKEFSDRRKGVE